MSDEIIEAPPERLMSDEEQEIAEKVRESWNSLSGWSERSLQSRSFKVGVSDLGFCSERVRRMLDKQDPGNEDYTKAFIGTAIGDHLEKAVAQYWPGCLIQQPVTVTLAGETHTYHVRGTPDVIRPAEGLVLDFKTSRGLTAVQRTGPSQQQQFQRHCYALGAWQCGVFDGYGPHLADLRVGNIWFDRTGDSPLPYVHLEPYSEEVVQQATWWLDETVYNFLHEQESRKEPPREMCAKVCGFYSTCRALDTDVSGLLTDDTVVASARMYRDALDMEKRARAMKEEAKGNLVGINGSTGEFTVRWVHINGGEVAYYRQASERLDVKPVK